MKNNIINKSIILLFFLLIIDVNLSIASDKMSMKIFEKEGSIVFYIVNETNEEQFIDSRFAIGPLLDINNEISIEITKDNIAYPFSGILKLGPSNKDNVIKVLPFNFVGSKLAIKDLKMMYSLNSGSYNIVFFYKNSNTFGEKDVYLGTLESNEINLIIQ